MFGPRLRRLSLLIALGTAPGLEAGEVEVLHWWTSGGEAQAAARLRERVEAEGHRWREFAVAGGGGEGAMTVLKSRALSGNPPSAAQLKGPEIQEWGELGLLGELDAVAEAQDWDALLPPRVAARMRHDGHYVAVPMNIHRINWLWGNPEVLAAAGVAMPTSLDELFAAGEALRAAGVVPLAHGGQPWQDATLFETVVLAEAGADFYRRALVALDPQALGSDTMIQALTTFRRLRGLMDEGVPGRDWHLASAMVIEGEAAMQLMGDWVKGEFAAAGLVAGEDYLCAPAPGTEGAFGFTVDSLAMFRVAEAEDLAAQRDLARLALSPEVQVAFNRAKGSIPTRRDLAVAAFDACARTAIGDFQAAEAGDALVPSLAHGMALGGEAQRAWMDIVSRYFNDPTISPEEAARRLVSLARALP
ncbi:ABC transporter substrate-binding protein [Halomonas pacifica]|uniref:ABC transporter substrate-binding protein n=1 Tax=Bisbaumannia pacifica TaxID=77098 RepID=UPI0023593F8B|nr:ABC transporter substrate-binding protein [Halomonas pacifica]MDC8802469.1 ABC transporter substrate-binding protein [Halomonas pacifica]